MANPLREILALFDVDTKGVEKGVKKSEGLIAKLTGDLRSLAASFAGAFAVKSIFDFGRAILAETDATAKLADSLGMGIAELQGWQYAADQSGVAAGLLTASIVKVQKATADAAAGQGAAASLFRKLGVEAEDTDGKLRPVSGVLSDILTALQGMEDTTARNALLVQMFGDQGLKLVPLLEEGTEGVAALRAEIAELGIGISGEFAQDAQQFSGDMTRLKLSFRGLMIQGLGPLLPVLIDFAKAGTEVMKIVVGVSREVGGWLRQTKFLHAGLALLTLKTLPSLVTHLGKAVAGVGGLRAGFMRLLPFLWKVVAPLLAIEDLFVFFAGGQSVFGEALDAMFGEGSAESFRDTILEILTLLKEGEFGEAIKKSFEGVEAMLNAITEAFMRGMIKLWNLFLKQSGGLGKMLGLEAIDEDAAIATIRGGQTKPIEEQTAAEKTARGVSEVATGMTLGALPLIGPLFNTARNTQGLAAALGELWTAPEKAADRASALPADADAAMALHQAAAAIETWQEKFPASVEFGALAPAPQDITNDVTIQNTINVSVPPGTDADMARRVGDGAARGTRQAFDTRALLGALVPQPVR